MVSDKKRILIMTAVSAEKDVVLRGLQHNLNSDVMLSGVGPVAAAVNTAKILSTKDYGLVISTGIGGGFAGRAEIGSLVVADEIVAADLGVETQEGFSPLEALDFGSTRVQADPSLVNRVIQVLRAARLPVNTGPIITVSTATGTAASTAEMSRRVPGVAAEGMEGYGVALAAYSFGVPVLEIRAISNQVGPRDRNEWRMKEAFDVLTKAYSILLEGLL
ncbi:futalosine hydrolase [Desulfitobacterium sp.]|uniref:futalosine hydrolase n=1 Tax=Desulfitobacterium sp. TaxID=49981 RepID=UPI002CD601B3|nr:futalosine hydrolase [Desulfitobacterium sp.]HVJ50078.1 futalosine hydrolase [Desulfitobacterium sp.]